MARNSGQQTDRDGWQTSVGDLARAIASRHVGIAQWVGARAASPLRAVSVGAIPAAMALARKLSGKAGWSRSLAERVSGLSYGISRSLQPGEFQGERSAMVLASRRRGMRVELEEDTPSAFSRYKEISFGSREDSGPSAVARAQHDEEPEPVAPHVPSTKDAETALSVDAAAPDGRRTPPPAVTPPHTAHRAPVQRAPRAAESFGSRRPQGPEFRPAESHPGEPGRGPSSTREVADRSADSLDMDQSADPQDRRTGEVLGPEAPEPAEARTRVSPDSPVERRAASEVARLLVHRVRRHEQPVSLTLRNPLSPSHAISQRLTKPGISRSDVSGQPAFVPGEPTPRRSFGPQREERFEAGRADQEASPISSEDTDPQVPRSGGRAGDTGDLGAAARGTGPVRMPDRSRTDRPQSSRGLAEMVLARHQPPAIAPLSRQAISPALIQRSQGAHIKSHAPEPAAGAPSSVPLMDSGQGIERISTFVPSAADRPDVTFVAKWPESQPQDDSPATVTGQPPGRFGLPGRTSPIPFVQRRAMPRTPEGDLPGSVSQGAHGVFGEIARRYRLHAEPMPSLSSGSAARAKPLHLQPALESGIFYPSSLAGPASTLAQRAPATYEQPTGQAVPASLPSLTGGVESSLGAYEPVEPILARVRSRPSQEAAAGETAGMPVQRTGDEYAGLPSESEDTTEDDTDLEALAREVYTIIRSRLAIERERAGCR